MRLSTLARGERDALDGRAVERRAVMAERQADDGAAQLGVAIGRAVAHEIVERQEPGRADRQRRGRLRPAPSRPGLSSANISRGQPGQNRAGGDLPGLDQPVIVDEGMRIGTPEAVDRRLAAASWKRCTTEVPPIIRSSPGAMVPAPDHADMRVDTALREHRAAGEAEMRGRSRADAARWRRRRRRSRRGSFVDRSGTPSSAKRSSWKRPATLS